MTKKKWWLGFALLLAGAAGIGASVAIVAPKFVVLDSILLLFLGILAGYLYNMIWPYPYRSRVRH